MENTKKIAKSFQVPLLYRIVSSIHGIEANFSKSAYKFWCSLRGGKFERKEPSRPNACLLVTKRSSHIFASSMIFLFSVLRPFKGLFSEFKNLFFRKSSKQIDLLMIHLSNLELEVYELNCPENASYGQGQKEHGFAFKGKGDLCYVRKMF